MQYLLLKPLVFKNFAVWNIHEIYMKFDTLLWAWGAEFRADASVKGLVHTFHLNPKCSRTLPLCILQDIFIELTTKYRSWNLTSYYGLEVQNFIQAFKSVKEPGNIFDLDRKWKPLPNCAVDIWHPAVFVCSVLDKIITW